jgi:hypothetical protein
MWKKPLVEGTFCDECIKALKPVIVENKSQHNCDSDIEDSMTISSLFGQRRWKWTRKYYFTCWITVLKNYMIIQGVKKGVTGFLVV